MKLAPRVPCVVKKVLYLLHDSRDPRCQTSKAVRNESSKSYRSSVAYTMAPTPLTPLLWHLTWRASCFPRGVSGSSNRDLFCSQVNHWWNEALFSKDRNCRQELRRRSSSSSFVEAARLILILITAVLYSAPSRKSTQERSKPNLGQTMWS